MTVREHHERKEAIHRKLREAFDDNQIICLDYVAEEAANRAIQSHMESCPCPSVYNSAKKVALGAIVSTLIGIGSVVLILWGMLKHSAGK